MNPLSADRIDDPLYSTWQAVHLTGATYRQIDYWARTETITPTVASRGSGTRRLFTTRELLMLAVAAELHELHVVELDTARRAAGYIRDADPADIADLQIRIAAPGHDPDRAHITIEIHVGRIATLLATLLDGHEAAV